MDGADPLPGPGGRATTVAAFDEAMSEEGPSAAACCTRTTGSPWSAGAGRDYHIIYTVADDVLLVVVVALGHRRDVYDR
ncbi:MAG: plasmid stabilization protein [Actinomycetota bacterium]|nr:plasmid stabilization protein [Actinomycetota bacterium]